MRPYPRSNHRSRYVLQSLGVVLALSGCADDQRGNLPDGFAFDASTSDAVMRLDATTDAADPADAGVDAGDTTCAGRSRWIYLLSFEKELFRYQPSEDNTVVRVGRIRCPDTVSNEPFDNAHNMTVDRSGRAWLFDQGGALYHVDTRDASCTATSFEVDQTEFEFLGATFVYDPTFTSTTTPEERLLVSGGPSNNPEVEENWSDEIATIDPDTLEFTSLGRVGSGGAVLLTSNGGGQLWSIFSAEGGSGLFPTEPATGELGAQTDSFPAEVGAQSSIVYWGGRFYVFSRDGSGTLVHTYTPSTEAWELVMRMDENIVGSGVSTCAPVVLI